MKANHISQKERLENRISTLRSKIGNTWYYKKPNPYPFCTGCHLTNVQINMDGTHGKGCRVAGIEKEIEHYTTLLKNIDIYENGVEDNENI